MDEDEFNRINSNPRNNIDNRSIEDIRNEITEFKLTDVKNLNLNEIEDKLSYLLSGHIRTPYEINLEAFFRARINDEIDKEFDTVGKVWYPDWLSIDKKHHCYGRCNDIGESIFYCSTEMATAILECRPKLNDVITIITFSAIQDFYKALLQPVGIRELQNIGNGYDDIFLKHYPRENIGMNTLKHLEYDAYLNELFKEEIPRDENWKYKASVAISKILLNGEFEGIVFPSVSAKMKGANYALKPSVLDSNFTITNGRMYKVKSISSGALIELEAVKILDKIVRSGNTYKDSKISWRNAKETDQELITYINC